MLTKVLPDRLMVRAEVRLPTLRKVVPVAVRPVSAIMAPLLVIVGAVKVAEASVPMIGEWMSGLWPGRGTPPAAAVSGLQGVAHAAA